MILLLLAAGLADPTPSAQASAEKILIAESVADLKQHSPARDVRSVRVVWHTLSDGIARPVICGEALSAAAPAKWFAFAALTTSGYEQYVGDDSQSRCKDADKRYGSRDITQLYRSELMGAN